MILPLVTAALQGLTGILLLAAGGYGCLLQRRMRVARRRASSVEALDAALHRWRLEKRRLRARAVQAWQADFDALLPAAPPAPPCTSSEHNHVENYRIGSAAVERICVVRPSAPQSGPIGGITVEETARALRALAAPRERILSPDEIEAIRRQAIINRI